MVESCSILRRARSPSHASEEDPVAFLVADRPLSHPQLPRNDEARQVNRPSRRRPLVPSGPPPPRPGGLRARLEPLGAPPVGGAALLVSFFFSLACHAGRGFSAPGSLQLFYASL